MFDNSSFLYFFIWGDEMRKYIILVVIIVIAACFVLLMPFHNIKASAKEKISPSGYTTYVVKEGDTLWSIAEQHPGNYSSTKECLNEIRRVNGIINPTIYAGDLLAVPAE